MHAVQGRQAKLASLWQLRWETGIGGEDRVFEAQNHGIEGQHKSQWLMTDRVRLEEQNKSDVEVHQKLMMVGPAGLLAALPCCPRSRSALHGSGLAAQPPRRGPSCPSGPRLSCPLAGAHSGRGPFAGCLVMPQCYPQAPAQLLLALSQAKQSE